MGPRGWGWPDSPGRTLPTGGGGKSQAGANFSGEGEQSPHQFAPAKV